MSFFHRLFFVSKVRYINRFSGRMRNYFYQIQGMHIGENTYLPKIYVSWPNQVSLGNNCVLEHNIFFKFDGIWTKRKSIQIADNVFIGNHCEFNISCGIRIGKYSNIASGCKFIDHDHGIVKGLPIGAQPSIQGEIILKEDVWLGVNVIVLKGVIIGTGAVIGAGAVVTCSIPPNEIWAGVPARKIAERKII